MAALWALYRRCFSAREIRAQAVIALLLGGALALVGASLPGALGWMALGALGWIVFEYGLHRWVLHAPRVSARHPRLRRAHDAMHRDHHLAPDDLDQLYISERGSVALALLAGGGGAVLGGAVGAAGVALGFTLAIIQYGVAHLAAHTDYVPLTRWGAQMQEAHRRHHDRDVRRWFGVLSPFPDLLAGTWHPRGARGDDASPGRSPEGVTSRRRRVGTLAPRG
jgi:sterol desaturase/sphingolipid hydroxylase (fatty acid hydroxylase superfamily)